MELTSFLPLPVLNIFGMKEAKGNHRLMRERVRDGIHRGATCGEVEDKEGLESSRPLKAVAPSKVRYWPVTRSSL